MADNLPSSSNKAGDAPAPQEHIWALLIGIETYPEHLPGARRDVERMRAWLASCGTPADNVRVLLDGEATRDAILNVFNSHLVQNPAIPQDAPILLYYAGHGAREVPPAEWVFEDEAGDGLIEFIVPVDALLSDGIRDADGRLDEYLGSYAIPDRTIGALLRRLARAKGNNVTVVFDCCHSSHQNRGIRRLPEELRYTKRSVPGKRLRRLTADVDRDIWDAADTAPLEPDAPAPAHRGAVFRRQNDSHVFLAACARDESVWGSPEGGLFTSALLYALADATPAETYDALLARAAARYRDLFRNALATIDAYDAKHGVRTAAEERPTMQTPQCEGAYRARALFAPARGARAAGIPKWFTVTPDAGGPGRIQIHAGANALVRRGTRFRLVGPQDVELGPARALVVEQVYCVAEADPVAALGGAGVRAQIVGLAGVLRYAVRTTPPTGDARAAAVRAALDTHLANVPATLADASERVAATDAPDVVLEASAEGVRVVHADPHLRSLGLPVPLVPAANVGRYFPAALGALARFHGALALGNPAAPHAGAVDVTLRHLPAPPGARPVDDENEEEDEVRAPGRAYAFAPPHNEAVVAPGKQELYALMLHSRAAVPLFPHVLFLDPMTLSVMLFYTPQSASQAPLLQGRELQLGRSVECYDAIWFEMAPGQKRDTGVLKIVLAPTEAPGLATFEQPPMLGCDDYNRPHLYEYLRATGDGTRGASASRAARQPNDAIDSWDTLTRFVTVRPDTAVTAL